MSMIIMRKDKHSIILGKWLFCLLGGVLLSACHEKAIENQDATPDGELVVVADVSTSLAHGWGYVYNCTVQDVLKGELLEEAFALTIKVGDYDSLVQLGMTKFMELNDRGTVTMAFEPIENDKPYVNGENAFIDKTGQTWRLTKLKRK